MVKLLTHKDNKDTTYMKNIPLKSPSFSLKNHESNKNICLYAITS